MTDRLLDRITGLLKKKNWYEMPRLLAMVRLGEIREDLREKNLHDTEDPLLKPAATGTQLDPEIRKKMIALAAERTSFPETAASYTLSGGTLFRYLLGPMRRDIAAVHCPTLILHGRRDRLVPVGFARALARRRRDWPLVELDGCGHVPQLEQPDRFVSTVTTWLDRVPALTG